MNDLSVPEWAQGWVRRPDERSSEKTMSLVGNGTIRKLPIRTPMDPKQLLYLSLGARGHLPSGHIVITL